MDKITELCKILTRAREIYYNPDLIEPDETILTDEEYDLQEMSLKSLDPTNNFFNKVGEEKVLNRIKINHKFPCLSMQKTVTITGVNQFWNKMRKITNQQLVKLLITPKLDGISASLTYKDGKLVESVTRGDGVRGYRFNHEYISNIKPILKDKTFNKTIRGELIIPKFYKERGTIEINAPLRNMCAGLINRQMKTEEHDFIRFIAYDILPQTTYSTNEAIILDLRDHEFDTVDYFIATTIEEVSNFFDQYMKKLRETNIAETDGLVLSVNDIKYRKAIINELDSDRPFHSWQIALKPEPLVGTTILEDVEWSVSKDGRVTPIGKLKEVKIGDVNINRVTLNNIKYIRDRDIMINDEITICRSNDVIPKFLERKHTKSSTIIDIANCPSCGNRLKLDNNTFYICDNLECESQIINHFLHWFRCVGIDNIGESSVEKIIKAGYDHIYKLYSPFNDINKIISENCNINTNTPTFSHIINTFEKSKSLSEQEIIGYYGIPGIGVKILQKYNINCLNDINSNNINKNSHKTLIKLLEWKNDDKKFIPLKNLIINIKPSIIKPVITTNKKKFCITGEFSEPRRVLIDKIKGILEYDYSDTVNKSLDLLICGKNASETSKERIAKKFGIKIIHHIPESINDI